MSLNPQMDVLYLQGLGHVLGIFTRNAEPTQEETSASSFVGDGLHLRGSPPFRPPPPYVSNQDLVIPPGLIGICPAPRDWRQIFQPFTLYVSGLPAAPTLASFTQAAPALGYTAPTLTITLTTGVSGSISVLAADTDGGAPVSFNANITTAQLAVTVALTGLIAGHTYNAFVFVPTYPIAVHHFVVP
jgi:hypothetical protein